MSDLENHDSKETPLNAETKPAIHKNAEQQSGNPPKIFVDLVEGEVKKHLDLRVKYYRKLFVALGAVIGLCLGILGVQINKNMHGYIDKQLSEKGINKAVEVATNAENKILAILSAVEKTNVYVNALAASVGTNQQLFMEGLNKAANAESRISAISSAVEETNAYVNSLATSMNSIQQASMEQLNQIKKNNDVVLVDDLQKLFVVEMVTNLVDGNKIALKYEPIPHTVRIKKVDILWWASSQQLPDPLSFYNLDGIGYVDGKNIVLTNNNSNFPLSLYRLHQSLEFRLKTLSNYLVSHGITTNYVISSDVNNRQWVETKVDHGTTSYVFCLGIASVEYIRKSPR